MGPLLGLKLSVLLAARSYRSEFARKCNYAGDANEVQKRTGTVQSSIPICPPRIDTSGIHISCSPESRQPIAYQEDLRVARITLSDHTLGDKMHEGSRLEPDGELESACGCSWTSYRE
jgi:hypothetical protein